MFHLLISKFGTLTVLKTTDPQYPIFFALKYKVQGIGTLTAMKGIRNRLLAEQLGVINPLLSIR